MARGTFRIYLGSAPGVGKTFAMLDEGWRRKQRGTDVVVGLVETHGRANTAAQIRDLEVIPRRTIEHRGTTFEELDTDAILARRPGLVLIDELAHTNVPGSAREKRWQDVEVILDAGIDVISTVNVQHLESLNDVVERITGIVQRETVPDSVVRSADQVELVDMSPEALRRRMAHGNIYPSERVDAALANYFRPGNLGALRELALLWVADRVEESLQSYLDQHGITQTWETRERVVVALTGAAGNEHLVRRAARMAGRLQGELVAVHVARSDGLAPGGGDALDVQRRLVEELGGTYREIVGDDVATALAAFARAEQATQLVLGASRQSRLREVLRGSLAAAVLRRVDQVDVHVIATGDDERGGVVALPRAALRVPVPLRRRQAAWGLCLVGMPSALLALATVRERVGIGSVVLLALAVVMAVAALGGMAVGVTASVVGFVLTNWYFVPPLHRITISESDDVVTLVVFVAVAIFVSFLVDRTATRTREAGRARSEARALARATGTLVGAPDPLPDLVEQLRVAFGLDGVAVLESVDDRWELHASAGDVVPSSPDEGRSFAISADEEVELVVVGGALGADDLEVLSAFLHQLRLALESRAMREEAAQLDSLAASNALRTALLQAVSHDLRTPLASIKASASGLLQDDVPFTTDDRAMLLRNIEAAADRLDHVVGNLLDMSRLQADAIDVELRDVALEDVVASALATVDGAASTVDVDVPESLPLVRADPALLERALANVVSNALAWSSPGKRVRVEGACVGGEVLLRIVDRGPGIPRQLRGRVFEPFQRLGDRSNDAGVGLGLAIARGFVDAMGACLDLEDTPGGGVTMTIRLASAEGGS